MSAPGGETSALHDPFESIRGRRVEVLIREDVEMSTAWIAVEAFGELGFEARLISDEDFELAADRIAFIGGNALWHKRALERIRPLPRAERPGVILWHDEPLPFPRSAGLRLAPLTVREIGKIVLRDRRVSDPHSNARHLLRVAREGIVDVLTVATRSYQAFLAEHGIASEYVPLGYHPVHGHLLDLDRDIDVLFLGDLRVRRRKRILQRLEREGLAVHAVGSYSDPRFWGESRTELLNRTKILLNIERHSGHLADMRLILGMATGALVLSEPIYLPDPYQPGRHYVEAEAEGMTQLARTYLADEEARRRITDEAHALVTEELTLKRMYASLVTLAARHLSPV